MNNDVLRMSEGKGKVLADYLISGINPTDGQEMNKSINASTGLEKRKKSRFSRSAFGFSSLSVLASTAVLDLKAKNSFEAV